MRRKAGKKRQQPKRQINTREKKTEKIHYRLIIGALIFDVVYHFFIAPTMTGGDIRYSIFIFWIPLMVGMALLAWYRREFLLARYASNKGPLLRSFIICFYLIQGIIFSFISCGQIARMTWDALNVVAARDYAQQTIECDVTQFARAGRSGIGATIVFRHNGEFESIRVSRSFVVEHINENPDDYKLQLDVQQGIWNAYIINHWELLRK